MFYPSKKDILFTGLLYGIAIFALVWSFMYSDLFSQIVSVLFTIAIVWLWFSTSYRIDGEHIHIKYGPYKRKVPIYDIEKIRLVKSITVAPALAIDRIEITYGFDYRVITISPKSKDDFVRQLFARNPEIKMGK
ncbi:PH domain-containing protein [Halalkalibacillus halophilus]|uniref:PH domain-containing protein n=1 Tax=Halalkalibacillus halophilus TaxID=392827 RepID=UPI000420A670|nr:PH domain-containing protein [Halalkalibacillus halophilus]